MVPAGNAARQKTRASAAEQRLRMETVFNLQARQNDHVQSAHGVAVFILKLESCKFLFKY
jgi:hypothetical protein